MTMGRWDPFRNVATLQDRINRMFEETFPGQPVMDESLSLCAWKPAVDIFETDQGICIQADLPGLSKADVSVELEDNVLTLKGERSEEMEVPEDSYMRRERCYGSFQRAFNLRMPVRPESIRASFKNGVLRIEIPKPEDDKPTQVQVTID